MQDQPAPPALAAALPRRRITVRPPPTIGPLATLGLFALLFGLLAIVLWWLGPDLARDLRIGNDTVAAADARIEEARCRSKLFVLKVCDVTYADSRAGAAARTTLWYLYIDAPGEERIALLRSRSDPAAVTTGLGLDKLTHRIVALALVAGILVFCIGVAVRVIQQGIKAKRAFARLSGQRLTPVVVEIERHNLVPPRRRMWVYLYDDGGKRGRAFIELGSKQRPLFVGANEKFALALSGEQGGTPLLLDAELDMLDLTETEKAAFYAACRAEFGGAASTS